MSSPTPAGFGVVDRGAHHTTIRVETRAMGTRFLCIAPLFEWPARHVERAVLSAIAEVRRLEALMSQFRADSEVSRINALAGRAPVRVGPDTFAVIRKSLWTSRISHGAFDITFASMDDIWHFGPGAQAPSPDTVERRLGLLGSRRIHVDDKEQTVLLDRPGVRIGLGGIAKGYAVDRAASRLRDAGLRSFLLQAGGDLYVAGRKPDGQMWKAGIRDPRGPAGSYFAVMPVEDHAFSTAGDYEHFYIESGRRYHHVLDPKTGYPADRVRSVTIYAGDALTADALDDAVFVLGPERGLALVESLEGVGAVIVDSDNRVHVSSRLSTGAIHFWKPSEGI